MEQEKHGASLNRFRMLATIILLLGSCFTLLSRVGLETVAFSITKAIAPARVAGTINNTSSTSTSRACSCLRVDAEQFRKHCSVSGWDWPNKNEELVTRCMDFLVSNTSQYMQLHQHDPSKDINCTRQLQMHTFWSGPMTWKLKAVIQSFLVTHYTEDISCRPKPILNIWLQTVDPSQLQLETWAQEWRAPYFLCSDQLSFKQWPTDGWLDWLPPSMFVSAANSTINATALHAVVRAQAQSGSRVSYSDAVRFLLLYRFGGIYIDGDVLVLRNMEPLSHFDFIYEWSFVEGGTNTAVFGAQQGNPFAAAVIQTALQKAITVDSSGVHFDPLLFNDLFHPLGVLSRIPQDVANRVQQLPSIPFDPIWLTMDTPKANVRNTQYIHNIQAWEDFFITPPAHLVPPKVAGDMFKGAFTYHWHNRWDLPFVQQSLFGKLVTSYEVFLNGTQPSAQGLKMVPCSDRRHLRPT